MIAIFWKELRENAKWGALGLLLFSLGLAYAWSSVNNGSRSYESYNGLLSPTIFLVTTLGAAVIGGALGLLQIVPEQARDRWAFLMHRPVAAASIFWGKVGAGVLIYLLATVPAFFVLAWWISCPGHLQGPFEWRMALPGFADILCGVIFYLAGLLTGLRKGHWWGSRALAIPGAFTVLGTAGAQMDFSVSLIWIALYTAAFLIAARAAFLSNGVYRLQGWASRCALFVAITAGTMAVAVFVQTLAGFLLRNSSYFSGVEMGVLKDGRPVAMHYENGSVKSIFTLDDQPVTLTPAQLNNIYSERLPDNELLFSRMYGRTSYRDPQRYFLPLSDVLSSLWFFVYSRSHFEVYERQTARYLGTLGQNGFFDSADSAQARSFEGSPSPLNQYYYQTATPIFGTNVFAVNMLERSVKTLPFATAAQPPVSSTYLRTSNESTDKNQRLVAVGLADGSLSVCDVASGAALLAIPNRYDIRKWSRIILSALPDGSAYYLFRYQESRTRSADAGPRTTQFEQYDAHGALVAQKTLPAEPWYEESVSAWTFVSGSLSVPVVAVYGQWKQQRERDPDQASLPMSRAKRISLITMALASLIAAALGLLRMRGQQMSVRARLIWALSILVTGIPGLLAFIGAREMTMRVACAACGSPRLVDREHCPKCAAAWPAPKSDGSEIFSQTANGGEFAPTA